MPKRAMLEDGVGIMGDAAPDLINILSTVSVAIPPPAGPIIKALAETCAQLYVIAKKYESSKKEIYYLSVRSVQVVVAIVNKGVLQKGSDPGVNKNLKEVDEILQEIRRWIDEQAVRSKLLHKVRKAFKADETIQEVNSLNRRLDHALHLFGLQSFIDSARTLSEIQAMLTEYVSENKHGLQSAEMIQSIERKLGPKVKTLLPSDPRCHPGTRKDLLDSIDKWLFDSHSNSESTPSIYWLTGVAGCGKSTISRSVIKIANRHRLFCSWFYFSRDYDNRRTSDNLLTSAALDLISSKDPVLIKMIYDAVENEKVQTSNFAEQFNEFLRHPLEAANFPLLLVWDALDECTEAAPRRELLGVLKAFPKLPRSTRIFLTSRPENDLELTRRDLETQHPGLIQHHDLTFKGDKHDSTLDDIGTYIGDRFKGMPGAEEGWPGDEALAKLRGIADGLFIIAQFVCNFVEDDYSDLQSFLEGPTYEEGGTGDDTLYYWYRTGLEHLLKKCQGRRKEQITLVMGTILAVQYPVSPGVLATLLKADEQTMRKILSTLSPFLIEETRRTEGAQTSTSSVRYIHKSISDFLASETAGDFHIDPVSASNNLAMPCLAILCEGVSEGLKSCYSQSALNQTGQVMPQGNQILPISDELAYACRFWAFHLKDVLILDEKGEKLLHNFFHSYLLDWLHLMGYLDALDMAVSCLRWVKDWKIAFSISDVMELASDGIRFIGAFHYPLRTCIDMECVSLHFTPRNTRLYEVYNSIRSANKCLIVKGVASGWPRLLNTLQGSASFVLSVTFSPDGKNIVSGSFDKSVRIWDTLTGQIVGNPLKGHTDYIASVMFSPDGKHIFSASYDGAVHTWHASTGQPVGIPLEVCSNGIRSISFSPDGKYIVSGSSDMTVRIWDLSTGKLVGKPLEGHTGLIRAIAFSSDGKCIVSGSDDGTVRVWDTLTGKPVGIALEGHTDTVRSVAFSPDGKRIVSGSSDATIRIWEASTGRPMGAPIEGHTDRVQSVAFSPDGKYIVSGSGDWTIRTWNASTRQPVGIPLKGHTGMVRSVAFSPDGKHIVSGSDDETICIWDASMGQPAAAPLQEHTDMIRSVVFSPEGNGIISWSYDKTVTVWDASTGQPVWTAVEGRMASLHCVAFSTGGERLILWSDGKTIRVLDVSTGQLLGIHLGCHMDFPLSVAVSPDGAHIVSGSDDGNLCIWDASTGMPVGSPLKGHMDKVRSVAYSPDGKYIVSGSYDGTVHIWNVSTGQPVGAPIEGHVEGVQSVAFSPDGNRIASGSSDMTVRIWNASTGKPMGTPFEGHTDCILSVAFSPDGNRIVSGSDDETIRIWDAWNGRILRAPLEHKSGIHSVAFSPDGLSIFSRSYGRTFEWDASDNPLKDAKNDLTKPVHLTTVSLHEDGWLKTSDGDQIVWLPIDHRGDSMAWSEPSRCFVVGAFTGIITIIKLL